MPSDQWTLGCVLALRIAGRPFGGDYCLRTDAFREYVDARERLKCRQEALQSELVDVLYDLVPDLDDDARALALRVKRDVFNQRPIDDDLEACLASAPLRQSAGEALSEYSRLCAEKDCLEARASEVVVRRVRDQLSRLVVTPVFANAVAYVSSSFEQALDDYTASPPPSPTAFAKVEKSAYDFASRFSTKSNPFHTFARVSFPPKHKGLRENEPDALEREVVLSLSRLRNLERHLLSSSDAFDVTTSRARLFLSDCVANDDRVRIFVSGTGGLQKTIDLKSNPVLQHLVDLLRSSTDARGLYRGMLRTERVHEVRRSLHDAFDEASEQELDAYLQDLVRHGVLVPFILRDPFDPASDFTACSALDDDQVHALDRFHHATVTGNDVPTEKDVRDTLGRVGLNPEGLFEGSSFFVDSYVSEWPGAAHEKVYDDIARDLSALSPVLSLHPNTGTARRRLLRALLDQPDRSPETTSARAPAARSMQTGRTPALREASPTRIALYELAARLRRDRATLFGPSKDRSASPHAETIYRLSMQTGTLSRDDLTDFSRDLHSPESLCLNGPVDYGSGTFYLSNIWAGNRRFVSRYAPYRHSASTPTNPTRSEEDERTSTAETPLDVLLYDPLRTNLNHVKRDASVGSGLTARHRSLFDRWLYLSDVEVVCDGADIWYEHRSTRQRLQFHHRGMLLTLGLPLEYQILLVNHPDVYSNPFDARKARVADAVRFEPGLHFERVCLRRDRWVLAQKQLPDATGHAVQQAMALRNWMATHVTDATEHFYYRLVSASATTHKPRHLDVGSVLSVASFLRRVRKLSSKAPILIERMEPGPKGLLQHRGQRYVSEVMIEV